MELLLAARQGKGAAQILLPKELRRVRAATFVPPATGGRTSTLPNVTAYALRNFRPNAVILPTSMHSVAARRGQSVV